MKEKVKKYLLAGALFTGLAGGMTVSYLQSNMSVKDVIERPKTYNFYNGLQEIGYVGSIFALLGFQARLRSERPFRREPKLSNSDLEEIFE